MLFKKKKRVTITSPPALGYCAYCGFILNALLKRTHRKFLKHQAYSLNYRAILPKWNDNLLAKVIMAYKAVYMPALIVGARTILGKKRKPETISICAAYFAGWRKCFVVCIFLPAHRRTITSLLPPFG